MHLEMPRCTAVLMVALKYCLARIQFCSGGTNQLPVAVLAAHAGFLPAQLWQVRGHCMPGVARCCLLHVVLLPQSSNTDRHMHTLLFVPVPSRKNVVTI